MVKEVQDRRLYCFKISLTSYCIFWQNQREVFRASKNDFGVGKSQTTLLELDAASRLTVLKADFDLGIIQRSYMVLCSHKIFSLR